MTIFQTTNCLIRAKCCVLGNAGVGKTSLLAIFAGKTTTKNYQMSIHQDVQMSFISNLAESNSSVEVYWHDIAGNDIFLEYVPQYIDGANSFVIVYDVTNQESFDALSKWMQIIKKSGPGKGISHPLFTHSVGIIVANKTDLVNRRCISTSQGQGTLHSNAPSLRKGKRISIL
jgi:small GTP-binding protein